VDDLILVDDASGDETADLSRALGLHTVVHPVNAPKSNPPVQQTAPARKK